MERKKTLGTPAQKIPFGSADEPGDGKTEYRQHSNPGNQLIGGHQAAGQQHIGADPLLCTDHFGRHQQDDCDRRGNTGARQYCRQCAGQDDLADDLRPGQPETLPHADQVAVDIVGPDGSDSRDAQQKIAHEIQFHTKVVRVEIQFIAVMSEKLVSANFQIEPYIGCQKKARWCRKRNAVDCLIEDTHRRCGVIGKGHLPPSRH